jgi:hypothetical protein
MSGLTRTGRLAGGGTTLRPDQVGVDCKVVTASRSDSVEKRHCVGDYLVAFHFVYCATLTS